MFALEMWATPSSKYRGPPRKARVGLLFFSFAFLPLGGQIFLCSLSTDRMEIQETAEQSPSAPWQAGQARFWQRPSLISHHYSLGPSAPGIRPWHRVGSRLGPSWRRRRGTPQSNLPSPAGPSGVPALPRNFQGGSRARRAVIGNKAPRQARPRSGRSGSGPRPVPLTWAPRPGTLPGCLHPLTGGEGTVPQRGAPQQGSGAGDSGQRSSKLSGPAGGRAGRTRAPAHRARGRRQPRVPELPASLSTGPIAQPTSPGPFLPPGLPRFS